jgi:hypothetical protein
MPTIRPTSADTATPAAIAGTVPQPRAVASHAVA